MARYYVDSDLDIVLFPASGLGYGGPKLTRVICWACLLLFFFRFFYDQITLGDPWDGAKWYTERQPPGPEKEQTDEGWKGLSISEQRTGMSLL